MIWTMAAVAVTMATFQLFSPMGTNLYFLGQLETGWKLNASYSALALGLIRKLEISILECKNNVYKVKMTNHYF